MAQLKLSKDRIVLIDDEDLERVSNFKWHQSAKRYVATSTYKNKIRGVIYLHRFIMGNPKNKNIDHINGDTFDNRKSNLRICNKSQNAANSKNRSNTLSGYKGVSWHGQNKSWESRIKVNYKTIRLGLFKSKNEAAKAYNEAASEYFGEFAKLNQIGGY